MSKDPKIKGGAKAARDSWCRLEYETKKRASVEGLASLAYQGDAESARDMIDIAEAEIDQCDDLSPAVRKYLLLALGRIRSGESADHAFGLKRGRAGRPASYWKMVRDADIARAVLYFHHEQGMKIEDEAIPHVAATYDGFVDLAGPVNEDPEKREESVRKAYYRFSPGLKSDPGKE